VTPHFDPDRSVGFALKRLQQALRSRMDAALAEHGLSAPQYAVLALLDEHPGISNAELARRSFVAAPTMLRLLGSLDDAGLVSRAARTPELRTRGVALTDTGRARLAAATPRVQEFEDLLTAGSEPAHLEVIMAWLHDRADRLNDPAFALAGRRSGA
jgi:DNA-binding MarR family transcriptional regulator